MKNKTLLLLLLTLFAGQTFVTGQNFLRVVDPNSWWGPISSQPGWEEYVPHGIFEEVSLVVSPKGIYTEIEVYATITHEPDYWTDIYEVIWQFDLPAKTIVHDSWLWVEDEIIKADVVDYWTALTTYEDIVDRNQDPSFLYILPDNRYEIRIFPLLAGTSRRIKLSFLVPAVWDRQQVSQDLLRHIFQATDYPVGAASIAMPTDALWGVPRLQVDSEEFLLTSTVVGGTGDELHYLSLPGEQLSEVSTLKMYWDTPFTGANNTFVNTYSDGEDNFYQLAYLPDWSSVIEDPDPEKILLLLDHKASKTTTSLASLSQLVRDQLDIYLSSADVINIAVATTGGILFLDPTDWTLADEDLSLALEQLLASQDTSNLHLLLQEGLGWAQAQGDATEIYILAANDDYTYPPVADEVFVDLAPLIDPDLAFSLLDYQNENVSVIYYGDEVYSGNSYLYQLLSSAFHTAEYVTLREENTTINATLADFFPAVPPVSGIVDYNVRLQNGVCYERFNLSSNELNAETEGVLLQTGKYLGDLPLEIEGSLITEDNDFFTLDIEIPTEEVMIGDTLMQEMWYAQHLQERFGQVASNADREAIIDLSIEQRILTPLTAFLALEPGLGGEPCIGCLQNNGEILIFSTEEFDLQEVDVQVSPNPVVDYARIRIDHPSGLNTEDWQATIIDGTGRTLRVLPAPQQANLFTEWTWELDSKVAPGLYFCKISSEYGEVMVKVIVMK